MRHSREKRNYFLKTTAIVMPIFMALFLTYSIVSSNASVNTKLNLTDKQLLFLANYVYFDGTENLTTIGEFLDSLKVDGVYSPDRINAPSTGIKDSQAIEMFKEIEKDETLRNLCAVGSIDKNIRAIVFVNNSAKKYKDSEAVMVYQGTKGLEEPWLDNLEGAYYTDTDLQTIAGKFFDNVEKDYNITYVTGHSKGGNLSQYVTVTRGDKVKKCVSFDGQGFSQLFIDKYKTKLEKNASKITSICAHKDPVNALLIPIAPKRKYINIGNVSTLSAHTPILLYNKAYFNENGTYKATYITQPHKTVKLVATMSKYITDTVNSDTLQSACEVAAPAISNIVPVVADAMSYEDRTLIEGLYTEIMEKYDDKKESIQNN